STLTRLIGYNAIFGLGELDRGRELLESVIPRYRALGLSREVASLRNSIAFTLFRQGRMDQALAMENEAIETVRRSGPRGDLLASLVQLNTGRLYRHLGYPERALDHFQAAKAAAGSDFTPYLLQLMRASLAHLLAQRGRWAAAARELHHCLLLSRDLSGENTSYPALRSLAQATGAMPPGRITRGDEAFLYLYLNLGIACAHAGLGDRAEAYLRGAEARWGFAGEDLRSLVRAARREAGRDPNSQSERGALGGLAQDGPEPPPDEEQVHLELDRSLAAHRERIAEAPVEDLAASVAELLEAGKSVAVVEPVTHGGAVMMTESLVLCDPRAAELAARLSEELNTYTRPKLRSLLCLPRARELRGDLDPTLPLILQDAYLPAAERQRLAALSPYHLRAQVVDPEHGGLLHRIAERFEARTGIGVVATVAFYIFGWDLAVEPTRAVESFLASSIDRLVVGGRLLEKRHGAEAAENLLPFRPRLSIRTSVTRARNGDSEGERLMLAIRSSSARKWLELNPGTKALLDLCDGSRSTAEVAEAIGDGLSPAEDLVERTSHFLRRLHRQKAICFEPPRYGRGQ
ncbi:MAG: tetratricopeptide repeat protein, partial [Holophagales bacterium]|nr:tetratricopeptide repeat protein [Holophagales bacterium]